MGRANNSQQQPLIEVHHDRDHRNNNEIRTARLWIETKKLWHIVGPGIIFRIVWSTMNVVTQSFAGHLGDVQLASISLAINLIGDFSFGLLLGMGIYLQRSWIILTGCCILLLPLYIFASPILKALGQPEDVAEQTGIVALWFVPRHFSLAFQVPVQRFLQSQLKTYILVWVALIVFVFHVIASWLSVFVLDFGVVGLSIVSGVSLWLIFFGLFGYAAMGGCPETWTGFSLQAFSDLGEFFSLSLASGVMLCLESWYYRILMLMPGYLENPTVALDALSICMSINAWEFMVPFSFLAATGVRVANELGAGNGNGAKFASVVSASQSTIIGVVFFGLILIFREKFALVFTLSADIIEAVGQLSLLLAFTVLLNSIQPVLSGVAIGLGWQACVAYINIGCYYLVGLPLGVVMGWVLNWGVQGIWTGMIFGGTAIQTVILIVLVIRCDWENEASRARMNVQKWSRTSVDEQP